MADLVSPIVDIISRLWTCCATQTRYLCKLQDNKILLKSAMEELKEARDDVQRKVVEAEADPSEPKLRTDQVRGWLQRVEIIESEVKVILQKAGEQLSRARCLGVCCPPNNCCSNYKVGKSIAKKIPLVVELKGKGDFQELTFVVARPTNYLSKLQDNKILLRSAMKELKNVGNDVQRKVVAAETDHSEPKMRTDQVRGWLQSVENIESEVEVIMQTPDGLLSNAECRERDKLVVMKMASVDQLKRNGHFEEVTYKLPPPPVQPMNLVSTVGMESMFNKVWRLINNTDDKPVRIMGLYGTGGVGKTTLLEKINNEFNKISGIDVVIFVVVSKPTNVQAIQTQIGERLRLSLQGDERRRANEIFNMLRNKKFVILLDDIWERVDLQRIGIPSPLTQCNSSKVIFTTRSERVCGLMEATHTFQVECLPWEKAWSLFQDKVGEKALNYLSGGARELAKDVAKECGGLPLALITIGRAMSTKKSVEEWRDAIKTLRSYASKFEGMSDEVLPRLKLSYDNLSDETEKSCFHYCALFPEDHSIEITKLVELWIVEGFLDGFNNLNEARDRGHTIIGSLKSACLLESSGEDDVKMHDVIRDLALWVVNDCSSNTTSKKFFITSNVCERWRNAERICWNTHMQDSRNTDLEWKKPPTFPNLRTLLFGFNSLELSKISLPQSFFQFAPFLKVLDMSYTQLTELPTSICQLYELQYLNLSYTKIRELPNELRKLAKLKFLDLSYTKDLSKIPPGVIANLYELQVLKLVGLGLKEIPPGILPISRIKIFNLINYFKRLSLGELDRLKQLQEVTLTISTSLALEELLGNQKLQRICTNLELRSCANLKSISLLPPSSTTTSKGGLGNLISLRDLDIYSCGELEELIFFINDEGRADTSAAAAGLPISNNNKLEELSLQHLPRLNNIVWGEKYHHYMAAAQQQQQRYLHYASPFQNLYSISIFYCGALKDLTWVVYVESLEYLSVKFCYGLETIIELGDDHGGLEEQEEGASGGCRRVFRKLKTLQMLHLLKLKSICSHALVFPSIQTISIHQCQELKKLPLDSRSNINSTLQWIEADSDWWSELQWEDETINSKFLPYLNKGFEFKDEEDSDDFEEDPENLGDFEDRTLVRPSPMDSLEIIIEDGLRGHDEPSFVMDVNLTFHIGIGGGPSTKRTKRKKKQARMR